jgi:hypothetical protein
MAACAAMTWDSRWVIGDGEPFKRLRLPECACVLFAYENQFLV